MGAIAKRGQKLVAMTKREMQAAPPGEMAATMSKMVMDGEQLAALTGTYSSARVPGLTWPALLQAQREQFLDVVEGNNLKPVEGLLLAQAVTLNAIFADMADRAASNVGQYPEAMERYMRLALKAQSQSRATLETLAEVKNPMRFAYVRQANIANGPQQVNNGCADTVSPQNELQGDFNVVDTGTQAARIGTDAPAATVAQIHGTAHRRRKVAIQPKRVERRRAAHAARTR